MLGGQPRWSTLLLMINVYTISQTQARVRRTSPSHVTSRGVQSQTLSVTSACLSTSMYHTSYAGLHVSTKYPGGQTHFFQTEPACCKRWATINHINRHLESRSCGQPCQCFAGNFL